MTIKTTFSKNCKNEKSTLNWSFFFCHRPTRTLFYHFSQIVNVLENVKSRFSKSGNTLEK